MSERPLVPAPIARGAHGAVVAPHHLAAVAGLGVLRAGGSAVDAAIATNAVLGVVVPQNCGIGGDAFWLIWDASSRRQLALNVPGAVRSWGDAHARYGRLSRDAVLAPAIELARDGFPATDDFVADVEAMAPLARGAVDGDGFDRVFRPHGRAWRLGERVRLSALATTLETLARDGFDAFYDGDIGVRQATALRAAGCL